MRLRFVASPMRYGEDNPVEPLRLVPERRP